MNKRIFLAGLSAAFACYSISAQSFGPATLKSTFFSDANNWNQPQYGATIMFADINSDKIADVCGRGPEGIWCQVSTGNTFLPQKLVQQDFSDAKFWNQSPAYYLSIRFADVDGDGRVDICGRRAAGLYCALGDGVGGFGAATLWSAFFNDNTDGDEPHYGATITFGDINGDGRADVCARGHDGVYCAYSVAPNSFGPQFLAAPAFADAGNWFQWSNSLTLRLIDVDQDGRPDICARASAGLVCALNVGNGKFQAPAQVDQFFADGVYGWGHMRYGMTIMYGDIDHDGGLYACGRGVAGVYCEKAAKSQFQNPTLAQTYFSDANGFDEAAYYGTLRLADVSGDQKLDLCGRGALGLYCATSK